MYFSPFELMTGRDGATQPNGVRPYEELAAEYVSAMSRGTLSPESALARTVEARDRTGRLRTLALAIRAYQQGRSAEALARLRGIAFSNPELGRLFQANIAKLAALSARRQGRPRGQAAATRSSHHGQ